MKKIITIFGTLAMASSPTIALRNIVPHKTQNLHNIFTKTNSGIANSISVSKQTNYDFDFSVTLSNSDYNGFSGFLNQIVFKLSDYNYHAWPIYLFQWLDDNDFHSGPFPDLKQHTAQGFFNDPCIWAQRFETYMGYFGDWLQDKSDTAFHMATCWGTWGTFGQTVDEAWNTAVADKTAAAIHFDFGFKYDPKYYDYTTIPPVFNIWKY